LVALGSMPLLLLLRDTRRQPSPSTAPTSAAADD